MGDRIDAVDAAAGRLRLGSLVLDLGRGELLDGEGRPAQLRRQALEVLLVLGRRAGEVVTKDELMALVWPGVVVGDGSLAAAVADIRRVLGDGEHRLVRNVARRGYMLVSQGEAGPGAATGAASLPPAPPVPPRSPLRRWFGLPALLALVAVATAMGVAMRPGTERAATTGKPSTSIVVLPLEVDGDIAEVSWFADALLGDLIAEVARIPILAWASSQAHSCSPQRRPPRRPERTRRHGRPFRPPRRAG
ncbi:MAG: winged helix-turn-helix domain-containing protein [Piscinibacter sp.]|nr:winged helix-turn-helix domain-containing protein [Piscinibacter sp.]